MDWVVRVTPEAVEDLGETRAVPQLDLLDELFDRIIHGRSLADIASPGAIRAAGQIVRDAQSVSTPEEWERYPKKSPSTDDNRQLRAEFITRNWSGR